MEKEKMTNEELLKELAAMQDRFRELEASYKTLQTSEERYRDFLENIDDFCFETDLAGKFNFGNNALLPMLGYTQKEYEQLKRTERYITPEEAQRVFLLYNDIYRTGKRSERFLSNHHSKEGKKVTLEISASLIRDAEGRPVGFRGISRNVTERRKREEDLERYRDFFENIEDSIFEMDLRGRLTFFNEATCRNTEYSPEELRNFDQRKWYETKEDEERVSQIYNELYRTGAKVKAYEISVLTKSGEKIFFRCFRITDSR